jgi:site-specific DNA-methyltransferase (adenine-specific)
MSPKSLIDRPKDLLELINDCLKPKEIEKKKFGEVFTPMTIVNEMLDKLPKEVWINKKLKWFDPATGMGNFPIAVYLRLMESLKDVIKNKKDRKKHILENMLYMSELNKKNVTICRKIFDINDEYELNLHQGDSLNLDTKKTFGVKKFDIIVGNPPYNEELKKSGARPMYNKFIEYYISKCTMMSFIVPSRWFAGGKGLNKFRENMLNRTDIVYINHFSDATKIFGNTVVINGGVNYFLINKNYDGKCLYNGAYIKLNAFDVIVDKKYHDIINKFKNVDKITKYYVSQDHYKIQTNDKRLINKNKKGCIKCYVSQQKGLIKYINKKYISKNIDIDTYKVITSRAYGSYNCFGNIFIGKPSEVHTKSYISFNVNTKYEAESLHSYMKCKLPNLLLSLRKTSQDISESTCKWIPLPPLNRLWCDREVYKYYDLTDDEKKLVKTTKIVGFKEYDPSESSCFNDSDDLSNSNDSHDSYNSSDSSDSDDSDNSSDSNDSDYLSNSSDSDESHDLRDSDYSSNLSDSDESHDSRDSNKFAIKNKKMHNKKYDNNK